MTNNDYEKNELNSIEAWYSKAKSSSKSSSLIRFYSLFLSGKINVRYFTFPQLKVTKCVILILTLILILILILGLGLIYLPILEDLDKNVSIEIYDLFVLLW
jgi:hypothetical protein